MIDQIYKFGKALRIATIAAHRVSITTNHLNIVFQLNRKKIRAVRVKRRPLKKRKVAAEFAKIAFNNAMGSAQVYMAASQPIPKFKSGGK